MLDLTNLMPENPSLRAKLSQRSFWALRYHDGRVVNEWECDWSLVPRKGRVAVRLYCPNGQVAELGNSVDATDRLFQFKVGELRSDGRGERPTLAHAIGMLVGNEGDAKCWAWLYDKQKLVGPFKDNVLDMKFHNVGALSPDVLGIRAD